MGGGPQEAALHVGVRGGLGAPRAAGAKALLGLIVLARQVLAPGLGDRPQSVTHALTDPLTSHGGGARGHRCRRLGPLRPRIDGLGHVHTSPGALDASGASILGGLHRTERLPGIRRAVRASGYERRLDQSTLSGVVALKPIVNAIAIANGVGPGIGVSSGSRICTLVARPRGAHSLGRLAQLGAADLSADELTTGGLSTGGLSADELTVGELSTDGLNTGGLSIGDPRTQAVSRAVIRPGFSLGDLSGRVDVCDVGAVIPHHGHLVDLDVRAAARLDASRFT